MCLPPAGGTRRCRLLDVHVEQVGQEDHVLGRPRLEQLDALGHRVDQVRLVAVQRLVDERHAVLRGMIAQGVEGVGQVAPGRLAVDPVVAASAPASSR